MTSMPEAGRQSAHVLLDAVSVWDSSDMDASVAAVQVAAERLTKVGGYTVIAEDDGKVELDISMLLGAAMVTIQHLVTGLADFTGTDRLQVIADIRAAIDQA